MGERMKAKMRRYQGARSVPPAYENMRLQWQLVITIHPILIP